MSYSIEEIARATGLEAAGDLSLMVERPAEPADAGEHDLALAMAESYADAVRDSAARAAVLWAGADWQALGLSAALFAPRARVGLAEINDVFEPPLDLDPGVHPSAVIHPTAQIGDDCWIGPFTVIGPGVRLGAGARIFSHVSIGRGTVIGTGARLNAGVRLAHDLRIGEGFIAQANACIGGDGFSYVTPEPGSVEAAKARGEITDASRNLTIRRIASLGSVVIGDGVEVGAATCIDRGTVADTRIGSGTKIDNQVMIGHNVRVGENAMLCGQVGIAGSCEIGDRVVLGGQVGVGDHLKIGSDTVVAGGSLVGTDIAGRSIVMGAPAMPREQAYRQIMALRRLPRVIDQVREIQRKLGL